MSKGPDLTQENHVRSWWQACRWDQWWNYKLPPLFMAACAVFLYNAKPVSAMPVLWVGLLSWSTGLAVAAHVLNDWSDFQDDSKAGKHNRLLAAGRAAPYGLLGLSLFLLSAGCILLQTNFIGWLLTGANLVIFFIYSFPPVRLKGRGWLGGLADTAAVHFLPTLFFVLAASASIKEAIPYAGFFWIVCWCAWGIRGFVSHQLRDRDFDTASGLITTASGTPGHTLQRIALYLVIPLELTGMVLFISLMHQPLLWLAPFLYLWAEANSFRKTGAITLLNPLPKSRIFLQDFYEVWLPLVLVILLVRVHRIDVLFLLFHLLFFGKRILKNVNRGLRFLLLLAKGAARLIAGKSAFPN